MSNEDPTPERTKRYLEALRTTLETRRPRLAATAKNIGREAARERCSARNLAQMHEAAWAALAPRQASAPLPDTAAQRANRFFVAVMLAFAAASPARPPRSPGDARPSPAEMLRRRAAELNRCRRRLDRETGRRETSEKAARQGEERYQRLLTQSKFMQSKLRSFAHQLLSAQEQERREISRELHDEVVQTLVGINVELAALSKAASMGTRAFKLKIASTQQLVEKSVSAVHQFARDLRPAVLDDLGLIPALQALMKSMAARKKLRIRLTAYAGVEEMENTKRIVLYRVAQEALTNVTRHARASLVIVSIRRVNGAIRMTIRDNGRSFRVSRALSSKTNQRLGLLGMRERVEMVGGTLLLESTPGEGTTVQVDIPFATKTDQ